MQDDSAKITVCQVVGKNCLSVQDGRRLYKHFLPELQAGREIELDFSGVEAVDASFFNASFGFLLRDFEQQELARLVKVSHLHTDSMKILRRVIKNSRRYYQSIAEGEVSTPGGRNEGIQLRIHSAPQL
jgi:hypothetical protein